MTRHYSSIDQHDALYTVARAYPGGLEALALRMGLPVNVLRNKIRPNIGTHYTSFEQASLVMEFAQGAGVKDALLPLRAMNFRHNMIGLELPAIGGATPRDLADCLRRAFKEFSELAKESSDALEDGQISLEELERIEKEALDVLSVVAELRERAREKAEADSAEPRR